MPIELLGPPWPTIHLLQQILQEAPETGTYRIGGPPMDSITQLTRFREAGLRTPDFTTRLDEAIEWVHQGLTVFGRKFIHTRGNDIVLPRVYRNGHIGAGRWVASQWWSKYLIPSDEWRVHIFDGRTIARGRKVQTGIPWRKAPVRNIDNGWTYDFSTPPPKGLRSVARKAVEALGYPSGAVDILQVSPTAPGGDIPPTMEFYVLEVNRIPALTCPYTLGAWVGAIRRKFQPDID